MDRMYGSARAPTDGQSVEAQVAALTTAGAVTVSCAVASGAKTDGAQLREVLARLAAGDELLMIRLDRKRSPQSELRGGRPWAVACPPSIPHRAFVIKTLLGSAR